MGGTLPPTRDGHGGEPLPPKTPLLPGGEPWCLGGGLFEAWGGAILSRVFEAFLRFSRAPPLGGGEPLCDFLMLPPWEGGATQILGSILGVGGEQGGAHAEIFTSENLTGSPPEWGGARGVAFSVLGPQGGAHVPIWERSMNTPTLISVNLSSQLLWWPGT